MKPLLPAIFILSLFLNACDDKDDKAKVVDKAGSIEVTLHTQHLTSLNDLLTTHYVIWKNGSKNREFDVRDTIPSLGNTKAEVENESGDTQNATIPKDYDFFVTIK